MEELKNTKYIMTAKNYVELRFEQKGLNTIFSKVRKGLSPAISDPSGVNIRNRRPVISWTKHKVRLQNVPHRSRIYPHNIANKLNEMAEAIPPDLIILMT